MVGGAGNDIYFVDSAGDAVVENANEGNDIVYASIDYTIGANIESLILIEGAGAINGAGNGTDNALIGNSGNNMLDGKGGDDFMVGGAGNDIYFVDSCRRCGGGERQRGQRHRPCLDQLHHRRQCRVPGAREGAGRSTAPATTTTMPLVGNSGNNVSTAGAATTS